MVTEKRTRAVKIYFTPSEYDKLKALAGWTPTGVLCRGIVAKWIADQETIETMPGGPFDVVMATRYMDDHAGPGGGSGGGTTSGVGR